MRKFSIEEINERFNTLSPELKSIITSPEINERLEFIAQQNGLKMDELSIMIDLVGLVILGFISSNEFIEQFSSETGFTEKSTVMLFEDLNNELFSRIKTQLREYEEKNRVKQVFETDTQFSNKTNFTTTTSDQTPPTSTPSSPHADLEQAGDFKIENEASTDNNYSLKSPQRKSTFVIEPKKEQPMSKFADMAMFTPKTEEVEQSPKTEPETPTLTQETVSTRIEQSTQETKPISTNTAQVVREYPIQKTPEPEYEPKKDSVPAFDPKNFYNFSNIETDSNIAKIDNEFKVDNVKENITKTNSDAQLDSVADNGQIFQKTASQIHHEKDVRNKHSKISASQSYQPKINEPTKTETSQKERDDEKIKNDTEKENTALIDELIAHPKPIIATTAEVKQTEPEKTTVVPEKTAVVPENKKTVEVPINLPVEPVTPIVNLISPNAEAKAEKPVVNKFVSAFDNKPNETKVEIETKVETAPIITPKIDPDVPPLVNLIHQQAITSEEIPAKELPTKDTPTQTNNVPLTSIPSIEVPTNEDIRRDIRSKVSEYNPTTKWTSSIPTASATNIESQPKENSTILNENNKAIENMPLNDTNLSKEIKSSVTPTEIKPKTVVPPPINRPKGFDPYREPIQ